MAERRAQGENVVELKTAVGLQVPQNNEAEMSALGAMVLSEKALAALSVQLEAKHFYVPAHAEVFRAIKALQAKGRAVDLVTLRDELLTRSTLQEVGGLDYLWQMVDRTPTTLNARHYADIVVEKWVLRELENRGRETVGLAHDPGPSYEEIDDPLWRVKAIEQKAAQMLKLAATLRREDDGSYLSESLAGKSNSAVPTGIAPWDDSTGGLLVGDMTLLTAQTKGGKTVLEMQAVLSAARICVPTAVFSSELSKGEWATRAGCAMTGFENAFDAKASGRMDEWEAALSWLEPAVSFRSGRGGEMTLGAIKAFAAETMTSPGGVFAVDLAHDVKTGKKYNRDDREEAEVAEELAALAMKHQCAVLAVCQENEHDGKATPRGSKAWLHRCAAHVRIQRVAADEFGELVSPARQPKDGEPFQSFFVAANLRRRGKKGRWALVFDEQRQVYHGATGEPWSVVPPDPEDPFDY